MNSPQEWVDAVRVTSGQRWMLVLTSVLSPVLACVVIGAATDFDPTAVAIAVGVLALVSATRPDTSIGVAVIAVVVIFWLARIDDATTPAALVVGLLLFVFHAVTALMAMSPSSAVFDPAIVRRWLQRGLVVALGTVAVWGLVVAFEQRSRSGNAVLSLAAVVALLAATLLVRTRSMPRQEGMRPVRATGLSGRR